MSFLFEQFITTYMWSKRRVRLITRRGDLSHVNVFSNTSSPQLRDQMVLIVSGFGKTLVLCSTIPIQVKSCFFLLVMNIYLIHFMGTFASPKELTMFITIFLMITMIEEKNLHFWFRFLMGILTLVKVLFLSLKYEKWLLLLSFALRRKINKFAMPENTVDWVNNHSKYHQVKFDVK